MTDPSAYVGRFAPSPSGPLHQGSLVAALASWLDARAHGGRWLVRMEDVDRPRSVAGADRLILSQLAALGLEHDGDVWYQSRRDAAYQAAFHALADAGRVYPCACTRREIADSALPAASSSGERPYAGTCRQGLPAGRVPRAWRLRVPPGAVHVEDRWHGGLRQDVAREVGDFVLRRADGLWAYQLAVVVDDGAQKITHIVRGADLLGSTARQQVLQDALGLPRPVYLHVPLVLAEDGRKLSKQNGAPAIDVDAPLVSLRNAWEQLGFADFVREDVRSFLSEATARWARRWLPRPPR